MQAPACVAVERRDIDDAARMRRGAQLGAAQLGNLIERETAGVFQKYRLGHAASAVPPLAAKITTLLRISYRR
jgi:hypothetical protein